MNTEVLRTENRIVPKQVTLKPTKKHSWLPENHDGSFRFSKTTETLTLQQDRHTKLLNTGLTEEDEKRLEKALKLEAGTLSRYNKEYWSGFKVEIPKDGVILAPFSSPTDEIIWRVMLVHQEVANSLEEKNKTGFERYVMHSEEEEVENLNKEINKKTEAFKKLGEMSESQMVDFLKVYGKNPGKGASLDFIKAQVGRVADSEPQYFLDTVNNPSYKMIVFIKSCIEKGIIKESGGKYFRLGGEVLGYSMEQSIDYLSNRDNNEVYTLLKGQLEAQK